MSSALWRRRYTHSSEMRLLSQWDSAVCDHAVLRLQAANGVTRKSVLSAEGAPSAQGAMLDELDEDIEGTQTRLQAAQKRMNHVLKRAGMKGQICIVLALVALLAVLVVIAFS